MDNRNRVGVDTACIQVDYSRVRTFSVDYAIDLDKNGAKNNDCRYGIEKRGETSQRSELLIIPVTLISHRDE